jgi:ABC-type phosphate transport system auxiliary subunit
MREGAMILKVAKWVDTIDMAIWYVGLAVVALIAIILLLALMDWICNTFKWPF